MAVGTALFVGASTLVGAGVGGTISKAQGGSFWKGALLGGLAGAATGGLGAAGAVGASGTLTGLTGSALAKAAVPIALNTAMRSGSVTSLAGMTGITGAKSSSGLSKSAVENMAASNYSKSQVSPLSISQLQQGNQNIYGTFGNSTSTFTRARLLNT